MRKTTHINHWLDVKDLADAKYKIITGPDFDKDTARDMERIKENLDIKTTDNVLDFGCGIGRLLKPVSKLCHQVVGVDISEGMIGYGLEYCKDNENILFKAMQSETAIPIGSDLVDKIYSFIVLQHTEKHKAFKILCELCRTLKTGGKMLIQYPDIKQEIYFQYMMAREEHGLNQPILEFYTKEELKRIFEFLKLKVIDIKAEGTDWYVLAEKTEPTGYPPNMFLKAK